MGLTSLLIIAALAVFMLIVLYNRLVKLRQNRENAFADIDVQLKLRYDLVPNLVEAVKGYAHHEKELFEKVTEARARAMHSSGTEERAAAEGVLGLAITKLMAVAENYPDLKANTSFIKLQDELSDIENKIAAARRFFNNATNEYNTATEQFPSIIIARMFAFPKASFFDVGGDQRATLDKPVAISFTR